MTFWALRRGRRRRRRQHDRPRGRRRRARRSSCAGESRYWVSSSHGFHRARQVRVVDVHREPRRVARACGPSGSAAPARRPRRIEHAAAAPTTSSSSVPPSLVLGGGDPRRCAESDRVAASPLQWLRARRARLAASDADERTRRRTRQRPRLQRRRAGRAYVQPRENRLHERHLDADRNERRTPRAVSTTCSSMARRRRRRSTRSTRKR